MSSNSTQSSTGGSEATRDEFFGQPIIGVAVVTIVLTTVFTGLRVWSRAVVLRIFALEDWLLLLGWVRRLGHRITVYTKLTLTSSAALRDRSLGW
jgi:hypothetical protein